MTLILLCTARFPWPSQCPQRGRDKVETGKIGNVLVILLKLFKFMWNLWSEKADKEESARARGVEFFLY